MFSPRLAAPNLAKPTGRLKEKSYDPYTGVSTLQAAWVSRASEKQRRGRAGRCQPGVAFHCYSRTRSQALAELQLPELKRSPLDELCLQVCCLLLDDLSYMAPTKQLVETLVLNNLASLVLAVDSP